MKKLNYYMQKAKDIYENPDNIDARRMWSAIDKMAECKITLPKELAEMEWIQKDARVAPSLPLDALRAVVRFLSSENPKIHVAPIYPDPDAWTDADAVEAAIEWQLERMKTQGRRPPLIDIIDNMTRYSACAVFNEFLPYEARRSRAEKKRILRAGDFCWRVYSPSDVYPIYGAGNVLSAIVHTASRRVYDVMAEYGEKNAGVLKFALDKRTSVDDEDFLQSYVSVTTYMDETVRVSWFSETGLPGVYMPAGEGYELIRAEHKLGFLPWVYVDYQHPLMEGIYRAGLYENLTLIRLILLSKAVGAAEEKNTVITAPDPDNPNIVDSDDSPTGERILQTGTTMQRLPPTPIDQQLMTMYSQLYSEFTMSASVRMLLSLENMLSSKTPAAAVNAAQQTAITQLGVVRNGIERVVAELCHGMLYWTDATGLPFRGVRTRPGRMLSPISAPGTQFIVRSTEGERVAANDIVISPEDVFVSAELRPAFINDRMARINEAMLLQRIGVSKRLSLESIGVDPELNDQYLAEETAFAAMMQNEIVKSAQAQTPEGMMREANAGAMFDAAKGVDFRNSPGVSPSSVAPNETRVTINGTDDTGRPLA